MSTLLRSYPGDDAMGLLGLLLVQVAAVVLLAWVLARLFARRDPATRHGLWRCALAGVLLGPASVWGVERAGLSLIRAPAPRVTAAEDVPPVPAPPSSLVLLPGAAVEPEPMPPSPSAGSAPTPGSRIAPGRHRASLPDTLRAVGVVFLVAWVAGALVLALRLAIAWGALAVLRREARPIAPGRLDAILAEVVAVVGLTSPPRVVTSRRVAGPFAAGVVRPWIVLPEGLDRTLDRGPLRDVLVHECAHVANGDTLVGLAQRLAAVALWPQPLIYLLNRELARAREEVCDNFVLRGGDRARYARTLVDLAESIDPPLGTLTVSGLLPPHWSLADRVAGLLDEQRRLTTRADPARLATAAGLLLAAAIAVAASRPAAAVPPGAPPAARTGEEPVAAAPPGRVDRHGDSLPPGASMRLGTLRGRQKEGITGIAYTPDGKAVVTGSEDGTLLVWDATGGKPLRRLDVGIEALRAFALSPDGTRLAAVGFFFDPERRAVFHTVAILDFGSGRRLVAGEWPSGRTDVWSLAYAPDGHSVATGSGDGTVRLWDVATGQDLLKLTLGQRDVRALAFAPDGATLAASTVSTIHLWDLGKGREARTLEGHRGTIRALAFGPDGKALASAAEEFDRPGVFVWDVATGAVRHRLTGRNRFHSAVAFSPDGTLLAANGGDGVVAVWDAAAGRERAQLESAGNWAGALAFSPDGRTIAANGGSGVLHLWAVETGRDRLEDPEAHQATVIGGAAFTPDGKVLITASDDRTARVWDLAAGRQRAVLPHRGWVRLVALAPDGRTLATAASERGEPIRLWDMVSGREAGTLPGHDGLEAAMALAFTPDGKAVLSCGRSGDVRLQDVTTKQPRPVSQPDFGIRGEANMPGKFVTRGIFSPDGRTLAVTTGTQVLVGDLTTGKRRIEIPRGHAIAFSPDGTTLAVAARGKPERIPLADGGTRSVASRADGTIHLFDPASGREQRTILLPQRYPSALAFTPDGRMLAVASGRRDSLIHLFDVAEGRERRTFRGHESSVGCLGISPDGMLLASGLRDTTVLIWDLGATP